MKINSIKLYLEVKDIFGDEKFSKIIFSFPAEVVTSARKFMRAGPIRQQLKNGLLIIKYLRGVPPEILAAEYTQ